MVRKILLGAAALALILGLCGCGSGDVPETVPTGREGTLPQETAAVTTGAETLPTEAAALAASEAPVPEGRLFLTVSRITFSLMGESEEIYAGTVPGELVTWGSEDESVAVFQDGILTASGVGETTVFAEYGGQRVSCTVGCLAETQEELDGLSAQVLRAPKRLPPAAEEGAEAFFGDAAIVGDSISYILSQYEGKHGLLGHPLFLTRGGTSLNGFVRYYKNIYFRGTEMKLENALAESGVKKVFIMLGQNDLGYRTIEETFESWDILLERIRENAPDMEIYIQSCVPEWVDTGKSNAKNEKIDAYNQQLRLYAQEHDCHFVDIAIYEEDHLNRMPSDYSLDQSIHLNEEGCLVWMQALLAYAERQNEEETI